VRPFEAVVAALQALGARRLVVVVPFPGQVEPAARKWAEAGFTPTAVVGDPRSLEVPEPVEAIVLDYVGHARAAVAALRGRTAVPVIDLGEVGAEAAVAALERTRVTAATASR
jgi:maleate cis-trans isomerase